MPERSVPQAARLLAAARRDHALLDGLPARAQPATLDDAHALQAQIAALLGDAIAGWKVAPAPDGGLARGGLLSSHVYVDPAVIPAGTVPLLGVEAEIAFRCERDFGPRAEAYSRDEVAAGSTAFLAIEIVDSRFRGYPDVPFLDRVADFMSNGAFVRGADVPDWRAANLVDLDVELRLDGRAVVRKRAGHAAGDPLLPALALVNDLRRAGGIAAGTLVTTGTYTGLQYAEPGQAAEAIFHGLGAVRVRFPATT